MTNMQQLGSTTYTYSCGHQTKRNSEDSVCPVCEMGMLRGMDTVRVYELPKVRADFGPRQDGPERRSHNLLTDLVQDYLNKGWTITHRAPLTLRRGNAGWQVVNWCLRSL